MVKVAPLAIATGLVMLYGLCAVVQVESENIMPVTFEAFALPQNLCC